MQDFYDHVARGIYAEVAMMRPADYTEIKEIVEYLRPGLYRDDRTASNGSSATESKLSSRKRST